MGSRGLGMAEFNGLCVVKAGLGMYNILLDGKCFVLHGATATCPVLDNQWTHVFELH